MPTVDVLDASGTKQGSTELPDGVFAIEPNVAVMHQVVTAQLAARRAGTQSTKTRAEVRGGGAKPWKQKGTGRARAGSTRAPAWTGGGVAHAPKPRSYKQRTPKKMVSLALRSALSDRVQDGKVLVVRAWGWDTPRTKDAAAALTALGAGGRVLVVLDPDAKVAAKSFRNLPHVHLVAAGELNAYDVLVSDWVIFTEASLPTAPAPKKRTRIDETPVAVAVPSAATVAAHEVTGTATSAPTATHAADPAEGADADGVAGEGAGAEDSDAEATTTHTAEPAEGADE